MGRQPSASSDVSDLSQIQQIFRRLGASEAQAGTMAHQVLKRAEQLASEQKISPEQAMEHLLRVLIQGRQGEVPPEFQNPHWPVI